MCLYVRDQFNITIYFMCIPIYIAIYINLSTINFWFVEYTHTLRYPNITLKIVIKSKGKRTKK